MLKVTDNATSNESQYHAPANRIVALLVLLVTAHDTKFITGDVK